MFRDLCSVRIFISSISSMPCQSSNLVLSLDFAINSFLSRTILVSNLVPIRLLPLFLLSRLRFVFVSISSMSSVQYRRYILIRPLHVSQPSPPCIRLVIFNVFFTISSIHSNPSPSPSFFSVVSTLYSSRYPRQCLLTISTIHPSIPLLSLILTSVSPTFPSAISTFYLVAFVNVPSYSASIYF
jgi:hypothetical protein